MSTYPQHVPSSAQPKPYKDRRVSAQTLRIDGIVLIILGLVGGGFTVYAPGFLLVLSLAIVGVIVWAVGQIRESLEHPTR